MAFTEFCCRSGGSNLNAGTRTGNSTEPGTSADFTYASGNWVAATGVFTVASGNPQSDGVAVGDFASVYADGSTVTGFVGRVTARNTTTITVSLTAKAGTAPTDGTGNRTLKIGGAWKGPNGAVAFPFGLVQNTLTNASSHPVRVNLKNDATYSITSQITEANSGVWWEGYTASYGDGGRFTLDGSTNSIILLSITASRCVFKNGIFANNGTTGSNAGISISLNGGVAVIGCVVHDVRGAGITISVGGCTLEEVECYACNTSNTSNLGGVVSTAGFNMVRCVIHDNSGSNAHGVVINSSVGFNNVISHSVIDTNGGDGIRIVSAINASFSTCDVYNNGGSGVNFQTTSTVLGSVDSCNFVKNGGYGIVNAGASTIQVRSCGYGTGTQANTSGTTSGNVSESGAVSYASDVTPWTDPANGDFRISLATAKGAGRGTFTQTAASYTGTVGYPDIGAAQHLDSGGGPRLVNVNGGADQ